MSSPEEGCMSWTDGWVALDTETTGLGSSARVIEVAVVTFEGGEPVGAWSRLLYPENVDWENEGVKKALEVNRITREQLQGQPTFEEILPDLLVELSHDVYVAHNATFDMRMLNAELQRVSRPALSPRLTICTKNLASHLNKTTEGNRLQDVAPRWGIKQASAHRAVVDALVCGQVLAAMARGGHLPPDDMEMGALCIKAAADWKGKHYR
jgi:DNA polymerase III subunit epsilon